ncbi:MAG TPA: iron uptake system protein EfeO [Solirubrobacteraceae bacterium]|nr:iron uptake system protein EfeO [Solirubrobacteraceae bacterium]
MSRNVAWATRRATIATLVSLAALGLVACGSARNSANTSKSATTLEVTLTDQGCSPAKLTAPAGALTISVSNGGTSAVTEMELKDSSGIIIGERENVVGGLTGMFSLNVKPGRYVMNCPNGEREDNGVLLVTGNAAVSANAVPAPLLAKAVAGYRSFVREETRKLLTGVRAFSSALQRGDVQAAKAMFGPVRRHYEAIEPVAESFGDLDPEIDARVNDVPSIERWTGFHRIEQILWSKNTTRGTARYAKKLVADVVTLNEKVQSLDYQAAQLANGAVELLNEVASSKITGEEDRYSHTDLSDFQGNLTGARVAFELLRPALIAHGDASLASDIAERFAAVQSGLDVYRRDTPLGFAFYSELTPVDRRRLVQKLDALAEPLSTVAAKIAG